MAEIAVLTKSGLPPIKHNFCHYLVADPQMDGTEAYLKVNPDVKRKSASMQASRYLEDPEIRVYIGQLLEERQKRLEMDEDWVMSSLRDIHDRCMQAEPVYNHQSVVRDEDGEDTGERIPIYAKFDANGALKALELIGKHLKMFSDKVDAGNMNVALNLNLGGDQPAIEGKFTRDGKG